MSNPIKYKQTNLAWCPLIPDNWEVKKLKYIGFLYSGLTGKSGADFKQNENPNTKPFIPFTNIANNIKIDPKRLEQVVIENDEVQNCVQKGDLFFMMSSENYDDIGKSTILTYDLGECYLNSFCKGFRISKENIEANFLNYLLLSKTLRNRLIVEANGFTRINLKMEKVNDLEVFLPPLATQQTIANYLDTKTTQIDTLIAKKQELIKCLKEERTAIINQAVTKGINPKVKLKPSGIEWLGDIPTHWEVKKLKYLLAEKKGALKPGPFGSDLKNSDLVINGDYKVYTQRNVIDNDFKVGEDFIAEDKFFDLKVFEVTTNDILLTTRGTIGKSSIVPKDFQKGIIHPCLIKIQLDNKKILNDYLQMYFNEASFFLENVKLNSNSTIIDVIYGNTLKEITLPLPTIIEQSEILKTLQTQTTQIDHTIQRIEKEIELIQEYKIALINEVVTGKKIINE